ncbi:Proline-rich receptor-like protein kinase PERK12 [Sesamum angolense]|uniref:non-specific serine/threonine protein kinase n=1 Tax=Sesamum angolense TaxID=2727404 RepID=A0AAE1WZT6_9LAMI|nr:Proline-rich receptor-like protein kinase PERK12 [Sesamum angolense]
MVILTCVDVNWSVLKWLPDALFLNAGDELILLGLLHLVTPRALSLWAAAKLLGYKDKDDANKVLESTRKYREEEVRRRKEEFSKSPGLMQLQKLCEIEQVNVSVEVEAGSSRKVAAVRAAKRLGATWIILGREMKKDKQYFMDRLSCRISSIKSNNTVIELRGPINEHVSYDEMIPSYSWEDLSPPKSLGAQGETSWKETAYSCSSRPSLHSSQTLGSTSSFIEAKQHSHLHSVEIKSTMSTRKAIQVWKSPFQHEVRKTLESPHGGDENQMEEFENSICSVCRNRRPTIGLQRDFTYEELREATNGFSRKNFLSEGGFGSVFKGQLKDGLVVAVKQHKAASLQGEKEFKSEVHVLSQARHQNVVVLLGSCAERSHRLLVYEYVCNGSLQERLSDNSQESLNWEQRIKIALGAARGLAYLHARNIVHRDMRPDNILITHDHESMLGDFGLAKAQQDDTSDTGVVGTLGYLAPEYAESGKLSTKTDVYSYGVVLLHLITGLRTTGEIPEGRSLVGWAKPLLEKKNYPDLIDKRILDSHDVHQLFWMVLVAERCLKNDPDDRWTMEQVVNILNCINKVNTDFIIDFSPAESDSGSGIMNP